MRLSKMEKPSQSQPSCLRAGDYSRANLRITASTLDLRWQRFADHLVLDTGIESRLKVFVVERERLANVALSQKMRQLT